MTYCDVHRCRDCERLYNASIHGRTCPYCGGAPECDGPSFGGCLA